MKQGYRNALLAAVAVCLVSASALWLLRAGPSSAPDTIRVAFPPLPTLPDQRLKPLTPEQALLANNANSPSPLPIEPARPFTALVGQIVAAQQRTALDCLTAAIYYEAASEGEEGQRAVAQVVLNRVRHPAFPKTVCGVVFQGAERTTGCQFSFTCDGSLARRPVQAWWDRARQVAEQALRGQVFAGVGTATHYHTVWVLPYWASSLDKVTTIRAHIFYRWRGFWGRQQAFNGRYLGQEPALASFADGRIVLNGKEAGLGAEALAAIDADAHLAPSNQAPYSGIIAPLSHIAAPDLPRLTSGPRPLADQVRGVLAADANRGELVEPFQSGRLSEPVRP